MNTPATHFLANELRAGYEIVTSKRRLDVIMTYLCFLGYNHTKTEFGKLTNSPWARGVVGTIWGGKFPHTFSESSELVFYEKVWGPCQQSSLVPEITSSL